jgi:hypothetical protein
MTNDKGASMNRTKRGKVPKVKRQGQDTPAHALDSGESGKSGADDLPLAPGHSATPEEWRAWAEAITKAAKSAGFNLDGS